MKRRCTICDSPESCSCSGALTQRTRASTAPASTALPRQVAHIPTRKLTSAATPAPPLPSATTRTQPRRATFQIACDLIKLTNATSDADIETMLQAELSPNSAATSAPKGTVARPYKLPRSLKDPRVAAAFSSFTPRTFVDSNQALRRRENKLKRIADKAEQARKAAAIMNPTPLQIATATIPTAPRAGYMGVEISVDAEGLPLPKRTKPKVAPPTPPTTPPAETPKKPTFTIPFLSFAAPRHATAPVVHPPVTPPPSPPLAALEETEPQRRARVEAYLVRNHPKLAGFTFAHRSSNPGQSTTFVDASRRAFATRIERPKGLAGVSEELEREVRGTTTRPMKSDGLRGAHEIRQIGVHRETGAIEPIYSGAFTRAPLKWLHLMRGKAFGRVRGHVSRCLETHYPAVYEYHRELAVTLAGRGLSFLFGAYASFCINSGGRVACLPHRDMHNLGPGLCGVVPFGDFDSSRSGWLVLEEARLCIEVGAGDTILFPSAIFTHWNTSIHPDDQRNSLAFWCGASLFLWHELKGRSLTSFGDELRRALFRENKRMWVKAWERFPVL